MSKYLVAVLLLSAAPFAAFAQTTVDRMTCAQAIRQVEAHGMYWVDTKYDGPIPITNISPLSNPPNCKMKEHYTYIVVATRDSNSCHIGYVCSPN